MIIKFTSPEEYLNWLKASEPSIKSLKTTIHGEIEVEFHKTLIGAEELMINQIEKYCERLGL